MATTKEYKDFVLEQLNLLSNITCKPMMGEYLLYYNGIWFGGIYDDRLLVKIVDSNKEYNMQESIPYDGAKTMYLVDDIDNQEKLKDIVLNTYKDLPFKKWFKFINWRINIITTKGIKIIIIWSTNICWSFLLNDWQLLYSVI